MPSGTALSHAGSPSLAPALKSRHADTQLVARARAAAGTAHADVAVLVVVHKTKKARTAHVWVVDPHDEGPLVDEDVTLPPSGTSDAADSAWSAIASAFPAEAVPPAATPPPTAEPSAAPPEATADAAPRSPSTEESADVTPHAARGESSPPLFRIGAAFQGGSRHFTYVDRLTATLRPYDLWFAPMAVVQGEIDPFARSGSPWLERLGLAGDYARAFGVSSEDSAGARVSSNWQAFHIDLRERIPIGPSILLGAHAGYGGIDFSFDGKVDSTSHLPGVAYRFVRVGADGQGRIGDFIVYAEASYLAVQSTGAMGDLFPRESVGGVEAHAGVTRPLGRSLDVTLDLAYTRFFYNFRPQPGDADVAGGALESDGLRLGGPRLPVLRIHAARTLAALARRAPRAMRRALVLLVVIGTAGCPASLDDPSRFFGALDGDGGKAECPDIPTSLFIPVCATAGCHNPTDKAGAQGLDLESPGLNGRLVGIHATGGAGLLIDPVQPGQSVLYTKLGFSPPYGVRMPFGKQPLDDATIACVLAWIEENVPDAGSAAESDGSGTSDDGSVGSDDATTGDVSEAGAMGGTADAGRRPDSGTGVRDAGADASAPRDAGPRERRRDHGSRRERAAGCRRRRRVERTPSPSQVPTTRRGPVRSSRSTGLHLSMCPRSRR